MNNKFFSVLAAAALMLVLGACTSTTEPTTPDAPAEPPAESPAP